MSAIGTRSESELQQDLQRLKDLVEQSRVEEARKLAPVLLEKWPDSQRVRNWATVLEPPRVIASEPRPATRSFAEDRRWVREHGHEYPGCYLVTVGYRLIAADPDPRVVREKARAVLDLGHETPFLSFPRPEGTGGE